MNSQESTVVPLRYKLVLAILCLIGISIILLATNRFGAGLSNDSVGYIAIARHIANGVGIVNYDGSPFVLQPPLYPAILATIDYVFGVDPLLSANIVNAILYGLIVYLGGLLIFKHLSSFPTFALLGTLAIVFSRPLFGVSVWVWSEPFFIFLLLLSFISAQSYLEKNNIISLMLFSSSVALSSLTRYIGVTVILWGVLIILVFYRDSLKNRMLHLFLFTLISAFPLGLWLIRNYAITGTFFGLRGSSTFTCSQNLAFLINSLLYWYIPARIADHRLILMIVGTAAVLFTGLSLRKGWQDGKAMLRQIYPIVMFVVTYTAFLVISSTTTAYDQIDSRLLSPIYVPLLLFWLILTQVIVDPYRKWFSKKIVNSFLLISIAVWLVYPILSTILNLVKLISVGQVYSGKGQAYNGKEWMDSETIQYLLQHQTIESECTIYTNGPEASYILANLTTKMSPAKRKYNSPEAVDVVSKRGIWPEESNACLVWFEKLEWQDFLFTIDELRAIANIELVARFEDGAIYSITRNLSQIANN